MDFVPSLVQGGGTFLATTLSGATILSSTISGSTIVCGTIVGGTISGSTMFASTLSGATIVNSSINSGSTISVYALPACQYVQVDRGGTDQNGINNATTTQINYTNEVFDVSNVFDLSADRLTPTIAGKYLVIAQISFINTAASDFVSSIIQKNGTQIARADVDAGANSDNVTACCVIIVAMNGSTDYLEHYVRQVNVATTDRNLYGSTDKTFMMVMRLSA